MNRMLIYPSQQPTDTIFLQAERDKMVALGQFADLVLGGSTVVGGLTCSPTVPASLAVNIGPGSIYTKTTVDATSYGSLGIDVLEQTVKQGVNLDTVELTMVAPTTAGQAINYLIQAEITENDINPQVLSFFNSANPTVPFTGPGGSGVSQPTIRACTVALQAKAGLAATSGSQVTPAPDAGYVGLWVVTVAQGASALTSAQITQYASAPFVSVKLPAVPAYIQSGKWAWGLDQGTANQIVVNLSPSPASIGAGFKIRGKKIGTPSNGPMTVVVNGSPQVALLDSDGSALSSTSVMPANFRYELVFDGTSWSWVNSPISVAVGSLTASSGEGITVAGGGSVSLNYPGLSVEPTVSNPDLWSFFSQADGHHRVMSWAQLIAAIGPLVPGQFINAQVMSTAGGAPLSQTYTKTTGANRALVFAVGGGGAGGNAHGSLATTTGRGGGGQAGWLSIGLVNVSATPTVAVAIGQGGQANTTYAALSQNNGGSATAFGAFVSAPGGNGGFSNKLDYSNGQGGGGLTSNQTIAGLISIPGNAGVVGSTLDGGAGGGSFFGGAGQGGASNVLFNGGLGGNGIFGGGGGGGNVLGNVQGGNGGDGFILILEFS